MTAATTRDRRLSQEQLREQAREDGIVHDRRGRTSQVFARAAIGPIERLQVWAAYATDRVFEVRYVAANPRPFHVLLSNDSVSWGVSEKDHASLERAVDAALARAAATGQP